MYLDLDFHVLCGAFWRAAILQDCKTSGILMRCKGQTVLLQSTKKRLAHFDCLRLKTPPPPAPPPKNYQNCVSIFNNISIRTSECIIHNNSPVCIKVLIYHVSPIQTRQYCKLLRIDVVNLIMIIGFLNKHFLTILITDIIISLLVLLATLDADPKYCIPISKRVLSR